MTLEHSNFEFKESEKKESLLKFANSALNSIEASPMKFEVEKFEMGKKGSYYYGVVQIKVNETKFSVSDTEDDPELLILKLTRQIQRQLRNIRKFRHLQPYSPNV